MKTILKLLQEIENDLLSKMKTVQIQEEKYVTIKGAVELKDIIEIFKQYKQKAVKG